MLEKHLWNTFFLHPYVFWAYRFLEVKDWIVMWYPQTSNNCSCVSKNIFCSMHLGKDIWVSWKNNFCWVFADHVSFRFYVKHIWKNIFWAPIPFKRYQNTSGCSTVLYLVVEIQQLVLEIRSFPKVLWGDLNNFSKFARSSHPEVSCQKMFWKILQNSQKNIYAGVSFLIKLQAGNLKSENRPLEIFCKRRCVLKKARCCFRTSRS